MSEQRFKKAGEDEKNDFDVGFKIPNTKGLMQKLDDSYISTLQNEHKQEEEEDKKKGDKAKKRQKPRGGTICCCHAPGCRIGPFVEKSGGEGE